jgi:hypothetical protein
VIIHAKAVDNDVNAPISTHPAAAIYMMHVTLKPSTNRARVADAKRCVSNVTRLTANPQE